MFVWIGFFVLIAIFLALDLGVFHKKNTVVTIKDSLIWTGVWVTAALLFGIAIFFIYENHLFDLNTHGINGGEAIAMYYTGYVLEKSLSVDNIFVIALVFQYFKIKPEFQHRVLFWGIIGAVIFRFIMILLGKAFIEQFDWAMYVFGGILVLSALKMLKGGSEEGSDFRKSFGVRMLSKIYPIDWTIENGHFFEKIDGKKVATPLLATLLVVEFTDILFAVDSIPAIFSVTSDPFIILSSNIFAILGLRSLYFLLAGILDKFRYLKYSLTLILLFVGLKMIFHNHFAFLQEHTWVSLVVILSLLLAGILGSLFVMERDKQENDANEK